MEFSIDKHTIRIDDADALLVHAHNWRIRPGSATPCVAAYQTVNGKFQVIFLARLLANPGPGEKVRYLDGNGLNLTRANLWTGRGGFQMREDKAPKPIYTCPFTPAMLEQLYWEQHWTSEQIGVHAAQQEGWERTPVAATVIRWLEDAGVRVRTVADNATDRAQRDLALGTGIFSPEAQAKSAQAAKESYRPILLGNKTIVRRKTPTEGRQRTAEEKRNISVGRKGKGGHSQGRTVEVICEECGRPFQRAISQVFGHNQHFCTEACWKTNAYKLANPVEVAGLPGKGNVRTECYWCDAPIRRYPAQMKTGKHHFCTPSCSQQYAASLKKGVPMSAEVRAIVIPALKASCAARSLEEERPCANPDCTRTVSLTPNEFAKRADACCSRECAGVMHSAKLKERAQDIAQDRAQRKARERAERAMLPDPLLDQHQAAEFLGLAFGSVATLTRRDKLALASHKPNLWRLSDLKAYQESRSHGQA